MNTRIKSDSPKKQAYMLFELENANEIVALIKEAALQLTPCAHCGFDRPVILYEFFPEAVDTLQEYSQGMPEMLPCHHEFCVWCNEFDFANETTHGCQMRTRDITARDDEQSIREALQFMIATWNRRPVV